MRDHRSFVQNCAPRAGPQNKSGKTARRANREFGLPPNSVDLWTADIGVLEGSSRAYRPTRVGRHGPKAVVGRMRSQRAELEPTRSSMTRSRYNPASMGFGTMRQAIFSACNSDRGAWRWHRSARRVLVFPQPCCIFMSRKVSDFRGLPSYSVNSMQHPRNIRSHSVHGDSRSAAGLRWRGCRRLVKDYADLLGSSVRGNLLKDQAIDTGLRSMPLAPGDDARSEHNTASRAQGRRAVRLGDEPARARPSSTTGRRSASRKTRWTGLGC